MIFTLATKITVLRILLIPFISYSIIHSLWFCAILLFIAACITDFLDGYIARNYNQVSTVGMLLDPIADKLLILSSLISFLPHLHNDHWLRYGIYSIFTKEIILIVCGSILYCTHNFFIQPNKLSRGLSVAEMLLLIVLLMTKYFNGIIPSTFSLLFTIVFDLFTIVLFTSYAIKIGQFFYYKNGRK